MYRFLRCGSRFRGGGLSRWRWGSCLLALDAGDEPVEALGEALALGRAGLLDGPLAVADVGEAEGLGDVLGPEGALLVLLVGEDEEDGVLELLLLCLLYTSPSPRDQRGSRMPSSA